MSLDLLFLSLPTILAEPRSFKMALHLSVNSLKKSASTASLSLSSRRLLPGLAASAQLGRVLPSSSLLLSSSAKPRALNAFDGHTQVRLSSHGPIGQTPVNPRKKVTIKTLQNLYQKNEPITMLTAHDFPSGHVAEAAGMEMVLVGDSLAMVALGMQDTSEVLLEEMILHCRSVSRAAQSSFVVCCSLFLSVSIMHSIKGSSLTMMLTGG